MPDPSQEHAVRVERYLGLLHAAADMLAVAYLLTGTYRYDPRLSFGPHISLNQVLGVALAIILVPSLWRRRHQAVRARATLGAVMVLAALLLVRLPASSNPDYGSFKLLGYVLLVLPVLLYVEVHARSTADLERLLRVFVLAAVALLILAVPHMLDLEGGERLAVLGGGPNVLARLLGTGMLGSLALAAGTRTALARWLWRAWIPLGALAMVLTGSKAGLLSTVLGLLLLLHGLGHRRGARGLATMLLVVALAPLVAHPFVRNLPKDGGFVRLLRLPDVEDSFGSYGSRMRYMRGSWEQLRAHGWLGVGSGAWGTRLGLGMERWYPHNLPVEVATELGLVGLALVLVPLVRLSRPRLRGADPLAIGLATFVGYWALNVQFSGDLVDSRYLWFFLALLEIGSRPEQDTCPKRGPARTMRRRDTCRKAAETRLLGWIKKGQPASNAGS